MNPLPTSGRNFLKMARTVGDASFLSPAICTATACTYKARVNADGWGEEGLVMVGDYQEVEVDFTADNPGLALFNCRQQLHMDFGFMTLFDYV
jgi:hypothetical protein